MIFPGGSTGGETDNDTNETEDGTEDGADDGTDDGTDNGTHGGTHDWAVSEAHTRSKAIDLNYEKTVTVKSFTDNVSDHKLHHLADNDSNTYWMSNEFDSAGNPTAKRLEFHFEVR